MPKPRAHRRYLRVFFLFFATFSLALVVGSGFVVYDHLTAGDATAEIVGVEQSRSTLYTVRFVTEDGRPCESILISDSPQLAGSVAIEYSQSCLNVWHPGDNSWIMFPIGSLFFLTIGLAGTYVAWFRTDPNGRIRWRLPLRYGGVG